MRAALGTCVLLLAACGGGGDDDACDPTREPCHYAQHISESTVTAGQETDGLCQSWTLDNPTELWVGNVAMDNGGAYHHSNWFFVPDNLYDVPDGAWDCSDHAFDELTAAITGGYLFAQSTQVSDQTQTFPDGVAVRIPPWSKIVGSTHILNASPSELDTYMDLSFDTIPPSELEVKLVPARVEYNDLRIDATAISSFTTDCPVGETHQDVLGAPFDYKIYYLLPHYHQLGVHTELQLSGGARDGEVIFESDGFGEAQGVAFDPPIDVGAAGATGLRYSCVFDNPRQAEVGWGIGDQEMCVLALFADTRLAWQGNAQSDEVAGTAPDGTVQHQSSCGMFGVEWDFDKAGGPPR